MARLYDKRTEFRLYDIEGVILDANDFIEIEEPKEFEALTMKLERITGNNNIPRHGFNYEYGDAETPLIFIKAAGYQLLQDIFEIKGSDAIVRFELGVYQPNYTPTFTAILDFNTYQRTWINGMPRIQMNVEAESVSYKLNARKDTKVNLLTDRDFDNNPITPLIMQSHYFHSKVIKLVDENGFLNDVRFSLGANDSETAYRVISGDDEFENEAFFISNLRKITNGSILNGLQTPQYGKDAPDVEDFPIIVAEESGYYKLDFSLNVYFTVFFDGNVSDIDSDANLELSVLVINQDETIFDNLADRTVIQTKTKDGGQNLSGGGGSVWDLNAFDEGSFIAATPSGQGELGRFVGTWEGFVEKEQLVYVLFRYFHDPEENNISGARPRRFVFRVSNNIDTETYPTAQSFINVTADTITPANLVRVLELKESINRVLEVTTGITNPLASSFYTDGCGKRRWVTNGFQLREFEVDDRPPEMSFSDVINSLNLIDAVGFGFEKDNGNVKVRLEPIEYFYKDAEILKIDKNVYKYEEYIADEIILNEVVLSFSKYIDEELNTLDSYTTKAEWLTPIVTKATKLELISQFIADGYAIEYTRRKAFRNEPNESWKYDNDIFIVDYVDIVGIGGANAINILRNPQGRQIVSFLNRVEIPTIIPELSDLESFDFATFTYTVDTIDFDYRNQKTILFINETGTFVLGGRLTFNNGFTFKRPESSQSFSTVNNLISPETAYNLRMSMSRILRKHAKWINSGLNWKESTDILINTFYDHNKNLQTQLENYVTCTGGDLNRILLSEKADIPLSQLANFARYFIPIRVEYGADLSFAQNEYLRKALSGQSTDDNNYGYVSVANQDNGFTKIFINLHEYKPLTSQVEGWGYKKHE